MKTADAKIDGLGKGSGERGEGRTSECSGPVGAPTASRRVRVSAPHACAWLFSAVLVIGLSLLSGCSDGSAKPAQSTRPPITVELVTVEPQEIRDVVNLVGQLEAEESVLIKPEIDGVIESVEFVEGHEVTAGSLLFRLRGEEQHARLQEADANLLLAEEQYARAKTLATQRSISQDELDRALAARDAAQARRDLARVTVERTSIRAPFDGVLGARLVSPGDRIEPETGLVTIDAVARLRLIFTVPEVAVPLVHAGVPLELTVAPYPDEQFPGEVYFVAPSLDAANRRLLLKAWVPNPTRKLRPGMFATIGVEIARRPDALVVPESAIAYDATGPYVWRVAEDQTAERARVALGLRPQGKVEITEGLKAGDRIVSAGTHKVTPGAHLQQAQEAEPEKQASR